VHVRTVRSSTELLEAVAHGRYDGVAAFGDVSQVMTGGREVVPLNTELIPRYASVYPALKRLPQNVEGGKVVGAEAARGLEFLEALLEVDEGARRLGEVAFGLNYEIDRFTNNTLFDEKIGGTMHVALGSSFEELGGENTSALHWDLVCDLRQDGEVYADGELVWRAGHFLEQAQPARV